ncbi:ArsR family transcriptional regulator, partial [Streptomyces sp. NPDC060187]
MLRIHFTSQDLQNVRVARQPDPLWELVCSVCRLETGEGPGGEERRARQPLQDRRPQRPVQLALAERARHQVDRA